MDLTLSGYASIATIVTGFTAVTALVLVWWQTGKFRRQQIESVARSNYHAFLRLGIEYPQFASPKPGDIDVEKQTFQGENAKFVQYLWFVWSGMNALESMYYALGSKANWRHTIAAILDDHRTLLSSPVIRDYADTFEPGFHQFVRRWLYPDAAAQAPAGARGRNKD
jgi:hypothetical protein